MRKLVEYFRLVLLLPCLIFLSAAAAETNKTGQLLQEKPFHFKHKNYEDFVAFMKGYKGGYAAWTDESLKAAFPSEIFNRCNTNNDMKMSEVLYQGKAGIVRGWTIRPAEAEKKLPIVVYNRGGFAKWGRVVGLELVMLCRIASNGYMVVASDFRGQNEDTLGHDKTDLGYGDVHDSFDLLHAVGEAYPQADTNNIAVWGFSRGTTISAMMLNMSDKVRAVILHGMVADIVDNDRRDEFDEHVYPLLVDGYASLSKTQKNDLLSGISPKHLIENIKGKPAFLIVHGAQDKRTSAKDAMLYGAELVERGYPVEFHLYQNSGHPLIGNYDEFLEETIDWLAHFLP